MARTIIIEISDDNEQTLAHDILDSEQWLKDALAGKINACEKRLIVEGEAMLKRDPSVTSVPTDPAALKAMIRDHKDYKDRRARDAAAPKQRE